MIPIGFLKENRIEADLTQRELADQLGVAQSTLSMVEGFKRPLTEDLAKKLSNVLPSDPHELIRQHLRDNVHWVFNGQQDEDEEFFEKLARFAGHLQKPYPNLKENGISSKDFKEELKLSLASALLSEVRLNGEGKRRQKAIDQLKTLANEIPRLMDTLKSTDTTGSSRLEWLLTLRMLELMNFFTELIRSNLKKESIEDLEFVVSDVEQRLSTLRNLLIEYRDNL